jgi:hypothetical protein
MSACGTIKPIQDERNAQENFVFRGKKKQIKETKGSMTASLWLSIYFVHETTNELFALRSSRISFRLPLTDTVGRNVDVIYARACN